jgi:uncharacterized membrane protein YvlD (DUF360 family)
MNDLNSFFKKNKYLFNAQTTIKKERVIIRMRHLRAFLIKFVATLAVLFVILGLFYDVSFQNIFLISLVLGVVAYLVGDLFLLRRTNNTISTLADFGLSFAIIWMMLDNVSNDGADIFWATLLSSIAIALFEYFFHKYMATNVLNENEPDGRRANTLQYQTEASEEVHPDIPRKNDNT